MSVRWKITSSWLCHSLTLNNDLKMWIAFTNEDAYILIRIEAVINSLFNIKATPKLHRFTVFVFPKYSYNKFHVIAKALNLLHLMFSSKIYIFEKLPYISSVCHFWCNTWKKKLLSFWFLLHINRCFSHTGKPNLEEF